MSHKRFNDCIEDGCGFRACFCFPYEKESKWCYNHFLLGMVYVNSNYDESIFCKFKGCLSLATWSKTPYDIGVFCSEHKSDEYKINTNHGKCHNEYCFENGVYIYECDPRSSSCEKHKVIGMLKITLIDDS